MNRFKISMPKLPALTIAGVLCGMGLERRRSAGTRVATGLGFMTLGAALGAAAVLARALMLGRARQNATLAAASEANSSAHPAFTGRDQRPATQRAVS